MSARTVFATSITLAAALLPAVAHGGSTSSNISVTADVVPACSVLTNPVAFGVYNPGAGSPLDAEGNIKVTCSGGTAWQAGAGRGVSAVASILSRKMLSGVTMLDYNLFADAQRSVLFGDGTGVSQLLSNTGNGTVQVIPIYGRIPAGQMVPAGNYSDTVLITLTY